MELTVNIENYLTEDEIKQLCRDAAGNAVAAQLRSEGDIQRFLSNSSYHFVWAAVEEKCPDNMLDLITDKIPAIVSDLSGWNIFRPKNAWDREESKGWTLLQQALADAKPLIEARVAELVREIDLCVIRDILCEHIDNAIENLKAKPVDGGAP